MLGFIIFLLIISSITRAMFRPFGMWFGPFGGFYRRPPMGGPFFGPWGRGPMFW